MLRVRKFPIASWTAAGAVLCALAVNELLVVQPARRRIERSEAEAAALSAQTAVRYTPHALPTHTRITCTRLYDPNVVHPFVQQNGGPLAKISLV